MGLEEIREALVTIVYGGLCKRAQTTILVLRLGCEEITYSLDDIVGVGIIGKVCKNVRYCCRRKEWFEGVFLELLALYF